MGWPHSKVCLQLTRRQRSFNQGRQHSLLALKGKLKAGLCKAPDGLISIVHGHGHARAVELVYLICLLLAPTLQPPTMLTCTMQRVHAARPARPVL